MEELFNILKRNNIDSAKVYDIDKNLIGIEFKYPIVDKYDSIHLRTIRVVPIKQYSRYLYNVKYSKYYLSKHNLEDYEIIPFLEEVRISEYKSRDTLKKERAIEISPRNKISSDYVFTVDGMVLDI